MRARRARREKISASLCLTTQGSTSGNSCVLLVKQTGTVQKIVSHTSVEMAANEAIWLSRRMRYTTTKDAKLQCNAEGAWKIRSKRNSMITNERGRERPVRFDSVPNGSRTSQFWFSTRQYPQTKESGKYYRLLIKKWISLRSVYASLMVRQIRSTAPVPPVPVPPVCGSLFGSNVSCRGNCCSNFARPLHGNVRVGN